MRRFLITLAATSVAVSLCAQSYTITAWGPFPGGALSSATDVNNSGTVSGYSTESLNGSTRTGVFSGGTLTNLGLPDTTTMAWGWGLNDAGAIAGSAFGSGRGVAFVYQNGAYTLLPTLGGTSASARDLNNSGLVTGQAQVAGNLGHAFRHDLATGTMTDLGTLGGRTSTGTAINAAGVVVGSSDTSLTTADVSAFVAIPNRAMFRLGLSGGFSAAHDINTAGKVVGTGSVLGTADALGNLAQHAFLFTGEAVLDLGTLGGRLATGYGINDSDIVVGASLKADNNTFYAFIYQNGVMSDLNTMVPAGSGWVLNSADAINNAGVIVGMGTFAGEQRGFILTPTAIPEPSTYAALAGFGALGLVILRRRRR